MKPALKNPEDLRPLAIVYLGMALTVAALCIHTTDQIWLCILLSIAAFLCRVVALPHQHNHSHLETFHPGILNSVHNIHLSLLTGYTTAGWILQHGLGHHRLLHDIKRDPTYIGRFAPPDGTRWSRFTHVFWTETLTFWDARKTALSLPSNIRRSHLRSLWRQAAIQHALYIMALYWNPWVAFANLICANKVLRLIVVKASYDHHFRADDPVFTGSNDKLPSPWYLLNLGYHNAHHSAPSLHWTQLPRKHHEMKEAG